MDRHNELLRHVGLIKRSFPSQSEFNVFRALRADHDEVRLHSRFIAALIDPTGHPLGRAALCELMKCFDIPLTGSGAFRLEHVQIGVEVHSIDVLVTNGHGQALIIENKIYASDQPKQLRRYFRTMRAAGYSEIHIAYLTLHGHSPSDDSLDGLGLEAGVNVQNYSYDHHIRSWLAEVERLAVRVPHVRESVYQYLSVINTLTGKDLMEGYLDELVSALLTNDNIKRARDIRAAYTQALIRLQEEVWSELFDVIATSYPQMTSLLTPDSLPRTERERGPILHRFYQPSAKKRTYYGYFFGVPGYEYVAVGVEIEAGLYTGAFCPSQYAGEYLRASKALQGAGLSGNSSPTWPIWRAGTLSADFLEPDERFLDLLTDRSRRAVAIQQCARDLYETWMALQQGADRHAS